MLSTPLHTQILFGTFSGEMISNWLFHLFSCWSCNLCVSGWRANSFVETIKLALLSSQNARAYMAVRVTDSVIYFVFVLVHMNMYILLRWLIKTTTKICELNYYRLYILCHRTSNTHFWHIPLNRKIFWSKCVDIIIEREKRWPREKKFFLLRAAVAVFLVMDPMTLIQNK